MIFQKEFALKNNLERLEIKVTIQVGTYESGHIAPIMWRLKYRKLIKFSACGVCEMVIIHKIGIIDGVGAFNELLTN